MSELTIDQMKEKADAILELQDPKLNVRRAWKVVMAEHSVGEIINFLQYRNIRRRAKAMLVLNTKGEVVEWLLDESAPPQPKPAPAPTPLAEGESHAPPENIAGVSASVFATATTGAAPVDRRTIADIIVVKNPTGLGFNIVKNTKGQPAVGTWVKTYETLGPGVLVLDVDGRKEIAWIEKVATLPSPPSMPVQPTVPADKL